MKPQRVIAKPDPQLGIVDIFRDFRQLAPNTEICRKIMETEGNLDKNERDKILGADPEIKDRLATVSISLADDCIGSQKKYIQRDNQKEDLIKQLLNENTHSKKQYEDLHRTVESLKAEAVLAAVHPYTLKVKRLEDDIVELKKSNQEAYKELYAGQNELVENKKNHPTKPTPNAYKQVSYISIIVLLLSILIIFIVSMMNDEWLYVSLSILMSISCLLLYLYIYSYHIWRRDP